jgi:hypothetical protein
MECQSRLSFQTTNLLFKTPVFLIVVVFSYREVRIIDGLLLTKDSQVASSDDNSFRYKSTTRISAGQNPGPRSDRPVLLACIKYSVSATDTRQCNSARTLILTCFWRRHKIVYHSGLLPTQYLHLTNREYNVYATGWRPNNRGSNPDKNKQLCLSRKRPKRLQTQQFFQPVGTGRASRGNNAVKA